MAGAARCLVLRRKNQAYYPMAEEWRFDESGNPILEQFGEEGFVDCVLRITDLVESEEFYSFHLAASSENGLLGMDVAVRKDINAGFDAEMNLAKGRVY